MSESIALSGNALNAGTPNYATQHVSLTGTGLLYATVTSAINAVATYSPDAQNVSLSATITSPDGLVNAGNVTFTLMQGATQIGSPTVSAALSNGAANANFALPAGVGAGTYTLQAVYNPAGIFAASSDSAHTLFIGQAAASIVVTPYHVTYDANPHTPTGTATGIGGADLNTGLTLTGATHTNAGTYANDPWSYHDAAGNYIDASGTVSDSIGQATAIVTLGALEQTYTGLPLAATAITNPAGLTVILTYNASLTVPTSPGSYTVAATVKDLNYQGSSTGTLVIAKATPTITIASSSNSVLLQNPVTFTAAVSSQAGAPTGAVTFLDGTTPLGASTLTSGTATFTTAALSLNAHTITAAYSGDANFMPITSNSLTQTIVTIVVSAPGSGSTQTVLPGGTVAFSLPITPNSGTSFPSVLTLSVSGLPAGAVAGISPSSWVAGTSPNNSWTLAANTALTGNTTLTIQLPQSAAAAQPAGVNLSLRTAPLLLALFLLPFSGRMRRASKRLGRAISVLLFLGIGLAVAVGVTGCFSNSGYFSQAQKTYPIIVTLSSGPLSQSTTLSLTVE